MVILAQSTNCDFEDQKCEPAKSTRKDNRHCFSIIPVEWETSVLAFSGHERTSPDHNIP
jgi:hypothetical protein